MSVSMNVPVHEWGVRLSDAIRAPLTNSGQVDFPAARQLALHGDGQARNLEKEFTLMVRGLGITIGVILGLLAKTPLGGTLSVQASADLAKLIGRFVQDLAGSPNVPTGLPVNEAVLAATDGLNKRIHRFEKTQATLAADIAVAIDQADAARALELLDKKELNDYLPLHDVFIRFMAESFAWVLRWYGQAELLRFHLATAAGQRSGFERWDALPKAEFAQFSAFLLKQHMGKVVVTEDAKKFTITQSPCGSGGRLNVGGAYQGDNALPMVESPGPLTFGRNQLPVYCSHCAIWNGTATLRWFGHSQWVFDDPARADGGCRLQIYKRNQDEPEHYARQQSVPLGDE